MELKNYKNYLQFFISIVLFTTIIIYSMVIYFGWNKAIDKSKEEIEVALPVIDWQKYTNLSKQYEKDKMKSEK